MIQTVRPFQRTIEPNFPENDALPQKEQDSEKFDKSFNEWYEDLKINLDRVQDQLKTFFQTDINDSISTQSKVTGTAISSLGVNTGSQIQSLGESIGGVSALVATLTEELRTTNERLQDLEDNLYSE